MFKSITYEMHEKLFHTHFRYSKAQLPVLDKNKEYGFFPWGGRPYQYQEFPNGSSLELAQHKQRLFDSLFPTLIKIPATHFQIQDIYGYYRKYTLAKGQYLEGVLLSFEHQKVAYILTIPTQDIANHHLHWPLISYDSGY